jgi:hypothetical protein
MIKTIIKEEKMSELMRVKELAKVLVKKGKSKNINAARINIYNKIRYGLEHEIIDGYVYTSFEKIEKYDKSTKKGRPVKVRK